MTSDEPWHVQITNPAARDIKRLDKPIRTVLVLHVLPRGRAYRD